MPLEIRSATNADIPEVVRVIRAVYDEYGFTWDSEEYHADLYNLEGVYGNDFFVASSAGQLVGTSALCHHERIPGEPGFTILHEAAIRVAGTDCSLERLYVHPMARRQGVGSALFEAVVSEARKRGCTHLEMWSDKRFGDAHRLYQREGAIVVGDRICHDPDQSPEWGLLLTL